MIRTNTLVVRRGVLDWVVDVAVRPAGLVEAHADRETAGGVDTVYAWVHISVFYFANLLLYAAPLALAGHGLTDADAPDSVVAFVEPLGWNPDTVYQFGVTLAQTASFLFVATVLTLVTFHVGLVLAGGSAGLTRSYRAVSYSTGIYLAIMFSTVYYIATAEGIAVADDLLLAAQAEFIYFFIDLLGADFDLPTGRPDAVDPTQLTTLGQLLLTTLLVTAGYYLYVLYAGARISHGASTLQAAIACGFVLISPVIYVVSVVLFNILFPEATTASVVMPILEVFL